MNKCKKYLAGWLPVVLFLLALPELSRAQEYLGRKMDVSYRSVPVKEVLKDLTHKSGVEFLYNLDEMSRIGNRTFSMKHSNLHEVLNECFKDTGFGYKYVDGVMVIARPLGMNKADVVKFTGLVSDKNHKPLPGVTITVKGTTLGVATDGNGKYELSLAPSDHTVLVFSFIGMRNAEVVLAPGKTVYDVVLEEENMQLEDVVVTGYANINRSSFTGNTVSASREELLKVSSHNLISALQNFDPSMRIQENNEWGSDPNALPEFYIRGRSSIGVKDLDRNELSKSSLKNNPNLPMFILDGFEVSVEKIYDFDMNRVESVTILKDAAATAMYGSRAANGVIVVTTIAPKPGELRVTYNFEGSVTAPDLSDYHLMNAREKLAAEKASGYYTAESAAEQIGKDLEYQAKLLNIRKGVDTYWLSQPLHTVFNHKHSIYLEGGSENLRFGVDLKYDNQDGVMKKSDRNLLGAGFALDYRLKNLQIRNYISYSTMKSRESPYGSFRDYTKKLPYDEFEDEFGNYVKTTNYWHEGAKNLDNPLYEAGLASFDKSSYRELLDNITLNWYILPGLQLKGDFSITKKENDSKQFTDPLSSKYDFYASTNLVRGELYQSRGENVEWNLNAMLMFNRMIRQHAVNLTLGINAQDKSSEDTREGYRGFPNGEMNTPAYAYEYTAKPTTSESTSRLMGFLGLLNYSWNDIYLMDLSCRMDGSSEFGVNKKFAPFWSAGAGINVHHYWKVKEWFPHLDRLKIRGTYGQVGKINFPAYSALTCYDTYIDDWYSTGYGGIIHTLGNKDLKWEKTNTYDVGADFSIFRGALDMKVSYYNKKTVDLVTDVTIPSSSGFLSYTDNLGEVVNRGFEIILKSTLVNRPDFLLSVYGNLSHNKNEILKVSPSLAAYNEKVNEYYNTNEVDRNYAKTLTKFVSGGSLTSIFGMRSLGIDPANGQEMFLKQDGSITYRWDASEQVIIGNTEPDAQGSFGLNAGYKNFFLYVSCLYEFGGQRYNYTLVDNVENADVYNFNVDKRVMTDRWQNVGDIAPLKDIKDRNITTRPTSRFVQDYNVLSLNALTVGYDFKPELIRRMGLSMLRMQFNMKDIARFSSVKQERGLSYPYARTFYLTMNLSF